MTSEAVEYLFITAAELYSSGERVSSAGASVRLGSLAPTYALTKLGYDARTYSIKEGAAPAEALAAAAKRVVFGEMFGDPAAGWAAYRRLLDLLRNPREQAIFSIADDKFDDPGFLDFYRRALPDCLAVTAVSESLARKIRTLTSRPVMVAPEPYEGPRGTPHAVAARKGSGALSWLARRIGVPADLWRIRLLWFGYSLNLRPLLDLVPALEELAKEHPLLLTCVTNPAAELAELLTPQRTQESARFRVQGLTWSPQTMESMIAYSDLVLIPIDYRNPVKQAKSPNRLVAGLHGGRFVVAHPLPAYAPYSEYAWIGEDLCEGLRWALAHPKEVVARITRGQEYIDQRHSPEVVARFWLDVFDLGNDKK